MLPLNNTVNRDLRVAEGVFIMMTSLPSTEKAYRLSTGLESCCEAGRVNNFFAIIKLDVFRVSAQKDFDQIDCLHCFHNSFESLAQRDDLKRLKSTPRGKTNLPL